MSDKPLNPYSRLKETFREYVRAVEFPHQPRMFLYQKNLLHKGWSLTDLAERVKAADQLGYDVLLRSNDEGLIVMYRKRHPSTPWEVQS